YSFTGWNTSPDGSGTSYQLGSSLTTSAPLTLYAQWTIQLLTTSFDSNGAGLSLPAESAPYGSSITLPSTGVLNRSGYTLLGWDPSASALVPQYSPGASISPTTSLTLYAIWARNPAGVVFDPNGGHGIIPAVQGFVGQTTQLPDSTTIFNPHHTFQGWSSTPHGPVSEKSGESFVLSGNSTLYAQWSLDQERVRFVVPGVRATERTVAWGGTIHFPRVRAPRRHERFVGWKRVGAGAHLQSSSSVVRVVASGTFSAVFVRESVTPHRVVIHFDVTGASGKMAPQSLVEGSVWTIPSGVSLHRPGFKFLGWSTSSAAVTVNRPAGFREKVTRASTLFAVWKALPSTGTLTEVAVIEIFNPNSTILSSAMVSAVQNAAQKVVRLGYHQVVVYGYATGADSAIGAVGLSERRAQVATALLRTDLLRLGDGNVSIKPLGEGRFTNSALSSFRVAEIFAH
ncbi:MAG: hypothetical protein HKL87_03305, partial [Acidimicrobiaceae bacterium]|nr:hypothetical protein [Acidimicrobiaceae bacterium]